MAKLNKTISVYGTEQDFIEAIYDAFLEIDGVTMNPTKANISTIFSDSSAKATFTMTYHGVTFTFQRRAANNESECAYIVTVTDASISSVSLTFSLNYYTVNATATRTCKISLYANNQATKIILSDYNDNLYQYLFITYQSNGSNIILYKPNTNAITTVSGLTLNPLVTGTPSCIAIRSLPYVSPNNGVDTLGFTVFKDISGEKVTVLNGLKNCSTVPGDTVLTINGKDNYSIGTDVLIEV